MYSSRIFRPIFTLIKKKTGIPNFKNWPKNSGKIHKNREKNLQFFGVNDLKIQWTVLEIKFIIHYFDDHGL